MKWTKTHQSLEQQKEANAMSAVDALSPERARRNAQKMFERECKGWGKEQEALETVGRWCGMSARAFKRFVKGETKGCDVSRAMRVNSVYLAFCHRMIKELKHEVKTEIARFGHAHFEDLERKIDDLDAEVEAARLEAARSLSSKGKD